MDIYGTCVIICAEYSQRKFSAPYNSLMACRIGDECQEENQ